MNLYPLNATQEDMLRESNMETMENGFQVTAYFEVPAHRLSADDMAAACQKFLDTNHYAHVHLVRLEDGQFMISESHNSHQLLPTRDVRCADQRYPEYHQQLGRERASPESTDGCGRGDQRRGEPVRGQQA